MVQHRACCSLCLLLLQGLAFTTLSVTYKEALHLKRVGHGGNGLLAQFVFDLSFPIDSRHLCRGGAKGGRRLCNFDMFPAALGMLIDELGVHELGFSLTNSGSNQQQGLRAPLPVPTYPPRGLEVWARIEDAVSSSQSTVAFDRWRALLHGLGGLFRAQSSTLAQPGGVPLLQPLMIEESFGDRNSTTFSAYSLSPEGSQQFFYGSLPADTPCTDSLEPFVRSLPCRDKAGIASFLPAPSSLLAGDYLGLSVNVQRQCRKVTLEGRCLAPVLNLEHVLTVLMPDKDRGALESWVKTSSSDGCPFSTSSAAYLYGDAWGGPPSPALPSWLKLTYHNEVATNEAPNLVVTRSKGQEDLTRGVLRLWVENTDSLRDVGIKVFEQVPFFMEPLLHQWSVEILDESGRLLRRLGMDDVSQGPVGFLGRTPYPGGSKAASAFEYGFSLERGATAAISMPFINRFLHFEDFPPNPLRGLEVPPAIVAATYQPQAKSAGRHQWARFTTEALLIDVPTPDFSMPFNVVTLSSTLLAFFMGTMINILVKKSGGDKKEQEKKDTAAAK